MGANLADYVREAAAERGAHAALVVGATRTSWADLDSAVDAAASGMRASGLVPGDRVGLVLGNRPEFVVGYFGALRAGLVAVPLNPGFTGREIAASLGHAGVRLVVADRETVAAVRAAALPNASVVVAGSAPAGPSTGTGPLGTFDDLLAAGRAAGPVGADDRTESPAERLAVIMYTSGTTGEPRGAMLSHAAMIASVEQVAAVTVDGHGLIDPEDVVLLVLPLAHVYSLNGTLGGLVRQAATAVLVERFDVDATLRMVGEYGVTNIPGAPPLWVAWATHPELRERLAGVRVLFSGAAPLPAAVLEQITAATGLPVYEGYGLTEAAPGVTSTFVSGAPKAGSVGRPFPGVDVRLVDDDGIPVDPGDPGEIQVRGPNLFSGYWPDGAGGPDDQGWYATGDVAYAEPDGDLHLVDRRTDLVIVNGFNVYPREVEDVLQSHPGVAEAAVVGVAHAQSGEAVKAYVVARPGATLSPDVLRGYCAQRLARFKRPSSISVVPELPHSVTGKVAKRRLRRDA
ncbi:MAG: AMP-binding protein [Actinomycetes bacterium]